MLCQLKESNGVFDLQLRLPDALDFGKHLQITGVELTYGKSHIQSALRSSVRIKGKRIGSALSYRFVRDAKGYRLFVSTNCCSA